MSKTVFGTPNALILEIAQKVDHDVDVIVDCLQASKWGPREQSTLVLGIVEGIVAEHPEAVEDILHDLAVTIQHLTMSSARRLSSS